METIPTTLPKIDPRLADRSGEIDELVGFLDQSYRDASSAVEDHGLADWPAQIVHCDWHSGNMLFRGPRVVAVIDYYSAWIQQRVIDVANRALQFSIIAGGNDLKHWTEYMDMSRFKRFLRSYEAVPDCILSKAELKAIPWLMIEALVAESVISIVNTGSFALIEGLTFLNMVSRKIRWIQDHAEGMIATLQD